MGISQCLPVATEKDDNPYFSGSERMVTLENLADDDPMREYGDAGGFEYDNTCDDL